MSPLWHSNDFRTACVDLSPRAARVGYETISGSWPKSNPSGHCNHRRDTGTGRDEKVLIDWGGVEHPSGADGCVLCLDVEDQRPGQDYQVLLCPMI